MKWCAGVQETWRDDRRTESEQSLTVEFIPLGELSRSLRIIIGQQRPLLHRLQLQRNRLGAIKERRCEKKARKREQKQVSQKWRKGDVWSLHSTSTLLNSRGEDNKNDVKRPFEFYHSIQEKEQRTDEK